MEIAGSIVTAIVPPAYSQGAEEAKRDTQARVQIPAPNDSQASQSNQRTADRKGSTQGANSQLTAQYQALNDTKTAINKDGRNSQNGGQDGQKNSGQEGSGNEARHLGDRQSGFTQTRRSTSQSVPQGNERGVNITPDAKESLALQVQATVMGTPGTDTQTATKGAVYAASGTAQQKEAQKNRTLKQKTTYKMAQYQAIAGESKINVTNNAISTRYNSILPNVNLGQNISISI